MLEKDKVEKGQDMYSPDLYDGNYAKCKTPSSISAADMYCYCSQRLHKSSFPYVKSLCPQFSFSKHGDRRANRSNFYPYSFPVARNLVIDRWNSELASYRPHLSPFWQIGNFRDPSLATFYFYELTHFLSWMKNVLLFIYSTNILVRLFTVNMKEELSYPPKSGNVRPHSTNSIDNAAPL